MSKTKIIENVKILLYKENSSLIEKLNFENNKTFSEPLLLTYFNSNKHGTFQKEFLEEMMQGYFTEQLPLRIEYSTNKTDIAYIPELGYYNKLGEKIQECCFIKDTQIEVIFRPFHLLNGIFELASSDNTAKEIEMNPSLFEKFIPKIEEAFKLLKKCVVVSSPENSTV